MCWNEYVVKNLNIWLHVFEIFTILIGILDKFFVPHQFLNKNTFLSCFLLVFICFYFLFFLEERNIKGKQKCIFTIVFNRGGLHLWETNGTNIK